MPTYAVRLLSADGIYPATPLVVDQRGVLVAEDCAWYAVQQTLAGVNFGRSEIAWLDPDETRFLAAVYLAEADPWTNGRLQILTRDWGTAIELPEPISSETLIAESRSVALERFRHLETIRTSEEGFQHLEPDGCRRPNLRDCDYAAQTRALLDSMDTSSPLLHRGLYKLVMAKELLRYPKFMEESMLSAVISREAALELLRRKFSAGGERWRYEEVLGNIYETFPTGPFFVQVLQEDWAARVVMTHPVSEYGEFWTPPIGVDQCYEALDTLTGLYRYLLLDEVMQPPADDPKDIDPAVEANTNALVGKLIGRSTIDQL